MHLIRLNSGNVAHEMAVFSVTYVLNSDKKQLTGQQFIEKVAFIAQRSYDWVCHRPWKSYDWVFRTPRALPVRATRTARAQIVNVAPNNRTEIPTQSIEGRPLLMLDLMNAPEKYHEFSDLEFVKVSTDPFIYRFHRLEKAEMQKLQRYIDLTNQYPEHFAHVEKATLVTETKGKGEVTCPGIISARNDNIFPLFLRCDHRMKVGEDLKKYIYTQVREITELLTKIDYIIDFENLQQRLQFWRGSERMQLKLGESLTERIKEIY